MMRSETDIVNRLGLAKRHSKRMLFQRCKQRSGVRGGTQKPLAVVEAMKMENILRAEKSGVVKVVNAAAGDSLAVDAVILEME